MSFVRNNVLNYYINFYIFFFLLWRTIAVQSSNWEFVLWCDVILFGYSRCRRGGLSFRFLIYRRALYIPIACGTFFDLLFRRVEKSRPSRRRFYNTVEKTKRTIYTRRHNKYTILSFFETRGGYSFTLSRRLAAKTLVRVCAGTRRRRNQGRTRVCIWTAAAVGVGIVRISIFARQGDRKPCFFFTLSANPDENSTA